MKSKIPSLADLQAQMKAQAPTGWDNSKSKYPLAFMDKTPRAPRKLGVKNKHEEHDSQATIVSYLKRCCPSVLVASSCNGELWPLSKFIDQGKFYGWMQKLKNRGLLTGDPDLRLTWFPQRCIFLEKKKAKGGKTSDAQEQVHATLKTQGFSVYLMPGGIEEMREIIKKEGIPCLEHIAGNPETPF